MVVITVENSAGIEKAFREAYTSMDKVVMSEVGKKFGLTSGELRVIVKLILEDRGLTQIDIANSLSLDDSTLVPVIHRLENKGFVIRVVDPQDRRNNIISLDKKSNGKVFDHITESLDEVSGVFYSNIKRTDLNAALGVLKLIRDNAEEYLRMKN